MGWKETFFGGGERAATLEHKDSQKQKEQSETIFSNAESIKEHQELVAQAYDTLGTKERSLLVDTARNVPGGEEKFADTAENFNAEATEVLKNLS